MPKRYLAIWFRYLITDRMIRRRPELKEVPFVMAVKDRGRMIVKAASFTARSKGILPGMVAADCRSILPDLLVFDDQPGSAEKLLHALAEWCLRYTPIAAIDPPDGLILDVSGCPHLWGGERPYLKDIVLKLRAFGYDVRAAISDTIGAAWAISRFGKISPIILPGMQAEALLALPPSALRLETTLLERFEKLGLKQIQRFIHMPRSVLRRRFGQALLSRLDQALGQGTEAIVPVRPVQPYQERLPSLEPIRTATGIEIALKQLLEILCLRLERESKGLRVCSFKCFRVDGHIEEINIGTGHPSRKARHLFRLFEDKIQTIQPDLGIELFLLEAPVVEDFLSAQDVLWHATGTGDPAGIAELLDRLGSKVGMNAIRRYLPAEHYWPERSVRIAASLQEKPATGWRTEIPRPLHLLTHPEPIEVTVAIPDYPPVLFHYKGQLHRVKKADGPERIEQEWWIEEGLSRDYYCVEDEDGARYWIFRLGHYHSGEPGWFIHGFFA